MRQVYNVTDPIQRVAAEVVAVREQLAALTPLTDQVGFDRLAPASSAKMEQ